MRLSTIASNKRALSSSVPECDAKDISTRIKGQFKLLPHDPWKRRLLRPIARFALGLQNDRVRRSMGCALSFYVDALCMDERFGDDSAVATCLQLTKDRKIDRVLVPGCYLGGEDVQFWLRRGVKQIDGIDLNNLSTRWGQIVPKLERAFAAKVRFQQAPLERLPFTEGTFDLVTTSAVLEHIQNPDAISAEIARVLRPGGITYHSFGPLYFSPGGDHCIDAYGPEHIYDHLMLSEDEYQRKIQDQAFYDLQPDPNLPFWARHNQFSFAFGREYVEKFQRHFTLRYVVAKISPLALAFRRNYPMRWKSLIDAGVAEEDLLLKGVSVVMEKE